MSNCDDCCHNNAIGECQIYDPLGFVCPKIKIGNDVEYTGEVEMNDLETALQQLLELAKNNPDLLFKIAPNKTCTGWAVEFTKGGHWWGAVADVPEDNLTSLINAALPYFDSLTEEKMKSELNRKR